MFRRSDPARGALDAHVRAFFSGHEIDVLPSPDRLLKRRVPSLSVFEIAPGPRGRWWTYITSGCWRAAQSRGHGLEFVLTADAREERHVELLTMIAWYHCGPASQRPDLGHTVPLGQPWVIGSLCDHAAITLPYAYGPELEVCEFEGGHARLLSALPITAAERQMKVAQGPDALEERLEAEEADFANPMRPSVA